MHVKYTSRVGDGPFPTELHDEIGDHIREVGHEYGTVTKRRRIGWFDSVVIVTQNVFWRFNLCLNCVDVLTGLDEIKICTAYKLNGENLSLSSKFEGIICMQTCIRNITRLEGEDITNCKTVRRFTKENARNYIHRIQDLVGVKVSTFL